MDNLSASDIAAWWGAVVASLVLGWDILKWARDKARLKVSVKGNMLVIGEPDDDQRHWIQVSVVNTGSRPTTIKMVGVDVHKNLLLRMFGKAEESYAFPNAGRSATLPHRIQPGEEWFGLIPQINRTNGMDLREMSQAKPLTILVAQTIKPTTIRKRLVIGGVRNKAKQAGTP